MRQLSRTTFVLAVATVLVATSGCSMFRKKNPYAMPESARPLEVPPPLDTSVATSGMEHAAPTAVTRSGMGVPASAGNASGFNAAGSRADNYAKVGTALAGIPGVTVVTGAEMLGVYDVRYEGSQFLLRIVDVPGGSYVSAVDGRGVPMTDAGAVKLVGLLKTALGGQ